MVSKTFRRLRRGSRTPSPRNLFPLLSKKSKSTRNDQALLSLLQASDSEDESEVPSELANWRENDFNVSRTFYANDAKKKNRHSIDKKLIELLKQLPRSKRMALLFHK